MQVSERLIKVFSSAMNRELQLEDLKDKNVIDVLGLNSVDALEVLIRVEGEFGILVDDSDLSIELVSSFSTLQKYVEDRLAEAHG